MIAKPWLVATLLGAGCVVMPRAGMPRFCDVPDTFSSCGFWGVCREINSSSSPPVRATCYGAGAVAVERPRSEVVLALARAVDVLSSRLDKREVDRLFHEAEVVVSFAPSATDEVRVGAIAVIPRSVEVSFYEKGVRVALLVFRGERLAAGVVDVRGVPRVPSDSPSEGVRQPNHGEVRRSD